jgi:hypothetical protein
MRRINFFNIPNLSGCTRPWGSLSFQQNGVAEAKKIMFLWSKVWPVHRADYLTAICELIVWTMWYPCSPPQPATGIALLFRFSQILWD